MAYHRVDLIAAAAGALSVLTLYGVAMLELQLHEAVHPSSDHAGAAGRIDAEIGRLRGEVLALRRAVHAGGAQPAPGAAAAAPAGAAARAGSGHDAKAPPSAALSLLPRCSWAKPGEYALPPAAPRLLTAVWDALNRHNVMYTLHAGSLLGAYRHGGAIPDDGDSDVVLPVWRNPALIRPVCRDRLKARGETRTLELLEAVTDREAAEGNALYRLLHADSPPAPRETLCGMTRGEWVDEVARWLRGLGGFGTVVVAEYGGVRALGEADIVVSIKDERLVPPREVPLCRCDWYDVEVGCVEDAAGSLRKKYGDSFMRPDRRM